MADEKPVSPDPEQQRADNAASRKQSGLDPAPGVRGRDPEPDVDPKTEESGKDDGNNR